MSDQKSESQSPDEETTVELAKTHLEGQSSSNDLGDHHPTIIESDAAPQASLEIPDEQKDFGDYELLVEVARGGMGVVYRAKQKSLNRIVALKMILAGPLAAKDDLLRFRIEAEAAGRLKHPNIVTVHDVGEINGQHYFSMEFIEGESLDQRLRKTGPLTSKAAARYVLDIAKAIQHAHTHEILHRDLKPSNIVIDFSDRPHVTDFGLAKRLDGDSGQTRTGVIMGTPSYMSPEQAEGKTKELGPACDVYGLGAVLYELLTGRPPFRSETPIDTVMQVLENDPAPPTMLNPKVDADLQTICLKCLEKKPSDRYASAEELASDLNRYLNGDSIRARSFNLLDRVSRSLERSQHDIAFHTWSTMVMIIGVIVLVGHLLIFVLIWFGSSHNVVIVARISQFVAIGLLFCNKRGKRLTPTTGPERELWSIWIGYLIAYGVCWAVTRAMIYEGVIERPAGAPARWDDLILYPYSAVASGLAFFVMGSNYWGRCYAFGISFFILAVIIPYHLEWAPLEFGLLWSIVLFALGVRLRRLGQAAQQQQN